MSDWRRHAIYFAPAPGSALARFGADWLGRDPATGAALDGPDLPGLPRARAELTAAPRRYGFHATLKPPFRLAAGRDETDLDTATAEVAADCRSFDLRLRLDALGSFLALVPETPSPALLTLERACVTRLDAFRAPPTPEDLARRRAAGLDPVEANALETWGYPYVLDRFRFHMTLTGPLGSAEQSATRAVLATVLAPLLAAPVPVRAISRFGEDRDGNFRLVRRYALAPADP